MVVDTKNQIAVPKEKAPIQREKRQTRQKDRGLMALVRRCLRIILLIGVGVVVFSGIWVAVAGTIANIHFSYAANQMIVTLRTLHDFAGHQYSFARGMNEDLLAILTGTQQISAERDQRSYYIPGSWDSKIRAFSQGGNSVRMDVDLPSEGCRRIVLFMIGQKNIGLLSLAVRWGEKAPWSEIALAPTDAGAQEILINKACGLDQATVSMAFRLRN